MRKITLFTIIITMLFVLSACQGEVNIMECEETIYSNDCKTRACLQNECEINATRNCEPTIMRLNKTETYFGITTIQEIESEIKGFENEKCIITHNITNYEIILEEDYKTNLRNNGIPEEVIQEQMDVGNEKAKNKIGLTGRCEFDMDDLKMLVDYQRYYNPPLDKENYNCVGTLYEEDT